MMLMEANHTLTHTHTNLQWRVKTLVDLIKIDIHTRGNKFAINRNLDITEYVVMPYTHVILCRASDQQTQRDLHKVQRGYEPSPFWPWEHFLQCIKGTFLWNLSSRIWKARLFYRCYAIVYALRASQTFRLDWWDVSDVWGWLWCLP